VTAEREWIFPDLGSAGGYPPSGTLTSTSITGWMTCARCWAHDNIQHLTKPASVHFAVGTAVHHAAECVGQMVLSSDGVRDKTPEHAEVRSEITEKSLAVFDREVNKESDRNGTERIPPSDAEAVEGKNTAHRVISFAIPRLYQLYRQRGLVALEYQLPLHLNPFPFPMTGRCDAISGGPKKGLPLILSDIKTSAQKGRPDQNNRVQGGIYALFVRQAGEEPRVIFDQITKAINPQFNSYGLGPEGSLYMTPGQLEVVRETVTDIAGLISDGYAAYLNEDWSTFRRCFPIGQGWNGKHDFDHGVPEAHLLVA
jgi:hypothetical protein